NLKSNQVRDKLADVCRSFAFSKPVLDGNILSLDPAELAQLLPERVHDDGATGSSALIQETNAEDFPRLLGLGWTTKREHDQRNKEAATPYESFFRPLISYWRHLITLAACASTLGGIVRPISLAVFRLTTKLNFEGLSTGSSPGFAPLNILST